MLEVGHVEKSSSENSIWECLLGNGCEGQEAKIQSQSRFQVECLHSPKVPLCHKKSPTYKAGPQWPRLCTQTLDRFLPGWSRLCCSGCLTQLGDHPSSCLDWRKKERKKERKKAPGGRGRFATWTSQHCLYRRNKT